MTDDLKYLRLLADKFPTRQSVCTEIINLTAILNLPKGTEHFMSDLHGEYEAFLHIMNNCSGVIREKIESTFTDMTPEERSELCTLIYYPEEKLEMLRKAGTLTTDWYRHTLRTLIEIARHLSSKYTRSKVRKAMPRDYAYIIDELLHALPDEDDNQIIYHEKILDTIIGIKNADEFIIELSALLKRLAVDHLHIVGDFFDRGPAADKILDLLLNHPSIDVQWGNHDALWMGAAAGSYACIANVIRNNIRYDNTRILESGYGISLRPLTVFGEKYYSGTPMEAAIKAINLLVAKLEGQTVRRHPEYEMSDRLLMEKIDQKEWTIEIEGKKWQLNTSEFPTVDWSDPYRLSEDEEELMKELAEAFRSSERLNHHIEFLYAKGSIYKIWNENLLYHGCVPMTEDGELQELCFDGQYMRGRELFDYMDRAARVAYFGERDQDHLDFMWFLWGGRKSPLCGRNLKTFERTYIDDEASWKEAQDPYYQYYLSEATCRVILRDFGLNSSLSHIINGHTPIRESKGETPIKADGKLLVIDGGFCRAYQKKTGIAGYTLIYNSHGMRLKSHMPFKSVEKAIRENLDIESRSNPFEQEPYRIMVGDTDDGENIRNQIDDLKRLLDAYRKGIIKERARR